MGNLQRFYIGAVSACLLASSISADPSASRLQDARNSAQFDSLAKAFVKAVHYSTYKPVTTAKLPGDRRFFLEGTLSAVDVDDQNLAIITPPNSSNEQFSADSYKSLFLKSGIGLPFGFMLEAGFGHAFEGFSTSSLMFNVAFQAFDFANFVYTDVVPAISFASGVNYLVSGPSQFSFNFQTLIGGYHRLWLAQVSYILQFSYISLSDVNPTYNYFDLRHGITSMWPLYEGFYLTTDLFYPDVQASISVGYKF